MGILRTNIVSGIETPTPVTGSVVFDGSGDYLTLTNTTDFKFGTANFTIEMWINPSTIDNSSQTSSLANILDFDATTSFLDNAWFAIHQNNASIVFAYSGVNKITSSSVLAPNTWFHLSVVRVNQTFTMYVNGVSVGTITESKDFSDSLTRSLFIGKQILSSNERQFNGYISNLRILKGTALYTSNFTPPTRELQRIGDTVLLCCNNPDSAGAEATGKTITVNGNAAASTFSPGLVRDFTFGTQFDGVSKFDTQGYFVPPSGTTEQRSRGRGLFGGGQSPSTALNTIDYVSISNTGNAIDFGDLTQARQLGLSGGVSSHSRGVFGGGFGNSPITFSNVIDYVTISSTGNAISFGSLTAARFNHSSASNSARGLFAGGYVPGSINVIDYITIPSLGNASDFGDLSVLSSGGGAVSSPTRAVFALGRAPSDSNILDYVTIASTGNAQDFGDLTVAIYSAGCCSSSTRGLFAGNNNPTGRNNIDYITIATTGNAVKFGDLTRSGNSFGGTSNSIRGIFAGGYSTSPTIVNTIDYVTIASTGNASDFGDLTQERRTLGACSDSHGGLS